MNSTALFILLFAHFGGGFPTSVTDPATPISFGAGITTQAAELSIIPTIDQAAMQSPQNGQHVYARNFEADSKDTYSSLSTPSLAWSSAYSLASYEDVENPTIGLSNPPMLYGAESAYDSSHDAYMTNQNGVGHRISGNDDVNSESRRELRVFRFRDWLGRQTGGDAGLGYERVMFAPMVLDTAISCSFVGTRIRVDRGLSAPDRLEYLWSRANARGPNPETSLDLIDSMYRTEFGSANAAVISEIGMRSLNPDVNPNTVGFGDMLVGAKALIFDGKCTKVSSIFLTHLNTGPTNRGLGTGHVSLEPGLLLRHQWSDATFLHSEVKYRLPIGGTSGFAGDVLTTGLGVSTLWRDSDCYAFIPTLELRTNSFLFGGMTRSDGSIARVDGVTALEFYPGIRCAFSQSNMGTWEIGIASGTTFADNHWFDSRMILDIRLLK